MSLRKIARNKKGDDVLKLFEDVAHRLTSPHWDVFALQDQYQNLTQGRDERCKLITYSLLQPSIFEGFASATIAGACFEDTMLYRLWTAQGLKLEPVHDRLRRELRYDRHPNGGLITILYCTEQEWSKTFRDKMVEVDQQAIRLRDRIVAVVGESFGDEPFLWMANKDLGDDLFDHKPNAQRLPNSPHGLNDFQGFHNVVVLSALNPPPAHFHFMGDRGINGEEMKTAHYRGAVYQAVMRCSARNPKDPHPKRFLVMDRGTAEWLAGLFPGAKVEPLDGMGVQPRKGKPGRPALHESNAEKTRAYRDKQKREWLAQLDWINGTSLVVGRYPFLAQEVRSRMGEFAGRCDENTVYRGDIVTPSLTSGTAFRSIYDAIPLDYVDYTDDESFVAGLRDLHGRALAAKEDAGLFAPAHFDPDLAAETGRGLDNVQHIRGIWLDNDGGDLSHEEFVRLFPLLRVVVWNTYSSTAEKPRWRAFIPTTCAMSKDVHGIIMAQIERVLNKQGYWSKRQLDQNPRIKARATHGFDLSKFNAASLFYLPCQAKDPKDSFFIDHNDGNRGALNLHQWIERCILDLRPEMEPKPVATSPAAPETPAPASVSANLQAVRDKLVADQAEGRAGRQNAMIEKAVENWRSTPRGDGHSAFFRLGAALQRAGLDEEAIRRTLHDEAIHARSPKERRAEIKDILRSLQKRGSLGRAA
jgi:hypothetical protein